MADTTALQLAVERMSYGPDAIAHTPEGKTVFVGGGVPGDVVQVTIDSDGPSFSKGHVAEVIEAAADRVAPRCPYAAICGGCPWAQTHTESCVSAPREGGASGPEAPTFQPATTPRACTTASCTA